MQGNKDYAIAYLEHIDKGGSTQASDDTILAKSNSIENRKIWILKNYLILQELI